MKQWATLDAVERRSNTVSGAWVFRGTRVPVSALFENLKDGATVDEFLAWFPGVQRWQVEAILESCGQPPRNESSKFSTATSS